MPRRLPGPRQEIETTTSPGFRQSASSAPNAPGAIPAKAARLRRTTVGHSDLGLHDDEVGFVPLAWARCAQAASQTALARDSLCLLINGLCDALAPQSSSWMSSISRASAAGSGAFFPSSDAPMTRRHHAASANGPGRVRRMVRRRHDRSSEERCPTRASEDKEEFGCLTYW